MLLTGSCQNQGALWKYTVVFFTGASHLFPRLINSNAASFILVWFICRHRPLQPSAVAANFSSCVRGGWRGPGGGGGVTVFSAAPGLKGSTEGWGSAAGYGTPSLRCSRPVSILTAALCNAACSFPTSCVPHAWQQGVLGVRRWWWWASDWEQSQQQLELALPRFPLLAANTLRRCEWLWTQALCQQQPQMTDCISHRQRGNSSSPFFHFWLWWLLFHPSLQRKD